MTKTFIVNRRDIHYLRTTLESYDGMAVVRTVDPHQATIEVFIAPGCETHVVRLMDSLRKDENLVLREIKT